MPSVLKFYSFAPVLCLAQKITRSFTFRAPLATTMSEIWPVCRGDRSAASVNEFLTRARGGVLKKARPEEYSDIHVFIGNEAADLDSFVSSIVLAYFSESKGGVSAPVLNCSRADLALRGDVTSIIQSAEINVENLIFVDEVGELSAVANKITLVDHNELAPHQRALSSKVSGIVDHHDDVGSYLEVCPRIVEACGSCSSHVFELCPIVTDKDKGSPTLAALLLCAILIDTRNMCKEAGKGTQKDANAVAVLSAYLNMNERARTALFDFLAAKKEEQGHLSTRDLLKRDYKQFETSGKVVGIASAGISMQEWITRDRGKEYKFTTDLLRAFANERRIDFLLVMSSFTSSSGGYSRELSLWSARAEDSHFVESLLSGLRSSDFDLQLEPHPLQCSVDRNIILFVQKNVKASRKVVAPAVLRCLADTKNVRREF